MSVEGALKAKRPLSYLEAAKAGRDEIITELLNSKKTIAKIASERGVTVDSIYKRLKTAEVSPKTIRKIRRQQEIKDRIAHLTRSMGRQSSTDRKKENTEYTEDIVKEILKMRKDKLAFSVIAERLGFDVKEERNIRELVNRIANGKRGVTTRYDTARKNREALSHEYLNTDKSMPQLARERGTSLANIVRQLKREGVDGETKKEYLNIST